MTRNFCKELEIGTKKHFVETTSFRLDLGFFVNLTGFLLIFSLFAKDENEEKLGDFVFFWCRPIIQRIILYFCAAYVLQDI